MRLILHQFELKLKHTFKIAHDKRDEQQTLIVELDDRGFSGYGEATANKFYGRTIESMVEVLEKARHQIENQELRDPDSYFKSLEPVLSENSFAQCAVDVAAHDLFGKKLGKPIYEIWGLSTDRIPVTSYTIGIDTIPKMVEKMKEFPWPNYKIKLGTNEDIEIIRELRKHTQSTFRVDANCAWTAEDTLRNAREFQKLGVEFIEQPLSPEDIDGMKKVHSDCVLPVIADESCIIERDVDRCHGLFHGINIKLMKCGGLIPARRMIERARELDLKVMVGCMTESSVGISAISQLLPLLDYVDMDGSTLISNDTATGPRLENGEIVLSQENGTGARLTGQ